MADTIQLSTVMLCWNRLSLSRQCLDSYLQTISMPHELIIINNGSTDGTKQWLEGLAADPRIDTIIHRPNNEPTMALNEGLSRCRGLYLHIMENDMVYLDGWDRYVLDRFRRLPDLGQLSILRGPAWLLGAKHGGLVILSRANVGSSSVIPRQVFFEHGIRFESPRRDGFYNWDVPFSAKIRDLGLLIAWPDKDLAINVGHQPAEFARDPDYYIRNYRLKLFTRARLGNLLRQLSRGRLAETRQTRLLLRRLLNAYRLKLRRQLGRQPPRESA
jgi:glycosyltransferase involved in cell wall biosynthesis